MLSEMEDIRNFVARVLPDLPGSILNIVEETMQSLGVETTDDFQFIQEADLLCVLRPIQARKLIASWKQTSQGPGAHSQADVTPSTSSSLLTSPTSTRSSLSPCQSPSHLLNADWIDRFEIPTERFPEALMQCLERGKRPVPSLRREMVRIVAAEMMKACPSPTKHASTEIAKKLVGRYPLSLKDVIEGEVVGTGYHSLLKQLQARIDNKKRIATPRIQKRKPVSDTSDTDEVPAVVKASVQDTYGCVKWAVRFMPVTETLETQEEKKEKLKILWEQGAFSPEEVKQLMQCTYYSQRKAINSGTALQTLRLEWPFLFHEIGISAHYQELTGLPLTETFLRSVEKKGKQLLDFMATICAKKTRRVFETLTKLKFQRGQLEGSSDEVKDMVHLLLSYFNEDEKAMFHYTEETTLADEIQMDGLPASPCVIVCGTSCYTAKRCMLSIDGKIVNDDIPNFIAAINMMFGSYYCLNIHYPVQLRSSLEFLQRCFYNINPERGTKVETKKDKKQLAVNPRVLTLIADLADYEWRD
ncbi:uncharacterized protein LOC143333240 [Chaetodon auriga]|uniref:uncharacterized protein LOC143319959 n=1 Tax=Chaetodon auriga TaxID=39042 RepID=UPI004032FDCB